MSEPTDQQKIVSVPIEASLGKHLTGCHDPDCVTCQRTCQIILRHLNAMMTAMIRQACLPPITLQRWLPGDPPESWR